MTGLQKDRQTLQFVGLSLPPLPGRITTHPTEGYGMSDYSVCLGGPVRSLTSSDAAEQDQHAPVESSRRAARLSVRDRFCQRHVQSQSAMARQDEAQGSCPVGMARARPPSMRSGRRGERLHQAASPGAQTPADAARAKARQLAAVSDRSGIMAVVIGGHGQVPRLQRGPRRAGVQASRVARLLQADAARPPDIRSMRRSTSSERWSKMRQ